MRRGPAAGGPRGVGRPPPLPREAEPRGQGWGWDTATVPRRVRPETPRAAWRLSLRYPNPEPPGEAEGLSRSLPQPGVYSSLPRVTASLWPACPASTPCGAELWDGQAVGYFAHCGLNAPQSPSCLAPGLAVVLAKPELPFGYFYKSSVSHGCASDPEITGSTDQR